MSYSTLTHRAGGRAGIFTIPYESVVIVTWLNCCVILAGFAATIFGRLPANTLVDFYVVFSLKFDFFSEIKCVQSRAITVQQCRSSYKTSHH